MDLYEAIKKRKSIRNYSDEEIPKTKLEEIKKKINSPDPLYEDIKMDVHLKKREEVQEGIKGIIGGYGEIESPYYLIISSEQKDGYLENIGYTLEEIVLELTKMEIGTCWIGSHKDEEELEKRINKEKKQKIVIMIGFGYPNQKSELYRDPEKIKRKDIPELIINHEGLENWENPLESARLAPSAMNRQPWRFLIKENELDLYIKKRSRIINKIINKFGNLEKMNRIDAGISLKHIEIAAKKESKNITISKKSGKQKESYLYITTVEIPD